MATLYTFTFPQPDKLMNLNDRSHWAVRRRQVKAWREAAAWHALQLPKVARPMAGPVLVDIALPVRRNGRRDAHNFMPTCKAIIDGLVDAGVVPDDSTRYLATRDPSFVVGSMVTVHLTLLPRTEEP